MRASLSRAAAARLVDILATLKEEEEAESASTPR
jgi:hypothetical protein